jgi:hypothetical protein
MGWLARAFDPRDPSIDVPSLSVAAMVVTYLGLTVTLAFQGKIDLLTFAGGAVSLVTGAGGVAWGMAKARQADPVVPVQNPQPEGKPDA